MTHCQDLYCGVWLEGNDRSKISAQTYFYNRMGCRVRVVTPMGTRHFVYDIQGRVVAEYGASASEVKTEFIWAVPPGGNGLKAATANGQF